MAAEIEFSARALRDFEEIYDYIAARAGFDVADRYLQRIAKACERLGEFPARGSPRDDIRQGLRTIVFERRATIAYGLDGGIVRIVRILHAGRDLGIAFDTNDER